MSDEFRADQSLFARQTGLRSRRDPRQCVDALQSHFSGDAFCDQLGMVVPAFVFSAHGRRGPSDAVDSRQTPSCLDGDSLDDRVGQKVEPRALVPIFEGQDDLSNLGLIGVRDHHATRILDRVLAVSQRNLFSAVLTNLAPAAPTPRARRAEHEIQEVHEVKRALDVAESRHVVGVCAKIVFGDN